MNRRTQIGLAVAIASLAVGGGLVFAFESSLTRIVGMTLLFTFIVVGIFTIAQPEFLDGDDSDTTDGA